MEAKEILNLIECQKRIFEGMYIERDMDDFYRGIIVGMDIIKAYCDLRDTAV